MTESGLRQALFLARAHARLLRPGLAELVPPAAPPDSRLRRALDAFDATVDRYLTEAQLAA